MRWILWIPALAVTAVLTGCTKPEAETPPPPPPGPTGQIPMPGGPPGPGGPALKADSAAGKVLFAANCAGCHGVDGTKQGMGKPNMKDAAWQASETDEMIVTVIRDGHDPMPAFKDKLSAKEIADVTAFVRTLAPPAKP